LTSENHALFKNGRGNGGREIKNMLENEFTFLIKKLPEDLEKHPKKEIRQGYYSDLPSPLRIRNESGKFTLTKKIPIKDGDASRYEETELFIKKEEFELIWPVCKKSLDKTRYYYPIDNLTAEIDIYHGKLEGLVTVEVEFPNEAIRESFIPPEWFGFDITQEKWSANSVLADLTYEEVVKLIEKI